MTSTKRQRFQRWRSPAPALAALILAVTAVPAIGQQSIDEITELRAMIAALRTEYEQRIVELEERVELAEQAAASAEFAQPQSTAAGRTVATPEGGSVTAGNAFNPQVSVILDGNYFHDELSGAGQGLISAAAQPSHGGHVEEDHDHVHGADISNGFNMRETELAFTAAVDPYFDAAVYLAVESAGGIAVEEAWFATRNLPAGLRLKAGRFLSDVGYINNKHPHEWDFVDQNLAYANLLGSHGLQDTGLQLTWLPDLPIYTFVGAEILHGDQDRLGTLIDDEMRDDFGLKEPLNGPRLYSLFAKVAPDLGYDHTVQIGASYVHGRQHQEIHDEPLFETALEGGADLWGIDFVYKYDNPAAWGHRDFTLQAEYLRSIKDLRIRAGDPAELGDALEFTTDGMYIQGIYGFAPRWQLGLRYDMLGHVNKTTGTTPAEFGSSNRQSGVLTWTPTEFSRLRMQYSRNSILTVEGTREKFDTFWLQWLMSLGAHGAHRF